MDKQPICNQTNCKLIISSNLEKKISVCCRELPQNEWSGTLFYSIVSGKFGKDLVLKAEDFYLRDYCRHEGNFAPMVECAKFAFELQPHILYQIIDCKKPFGCHAYNIVADKGFYEMYNWIEYED